MAAIPMSRFFMSGLLAVVAVAILVLTATGTAAAAAPNCAVEGKTLKKTSRVRVYQVNATVKGDLGTVQEPRIYGCALATRDRLRLDERCPSDDMSYSCFDRPAKIVINGPWIASEWSAQETARADAQYYGMLLAKPGASPFVRILGWEQFEFGRVDRLFLSIVGAVAYSGLFDEGDGRVKQIRAISAPQRNRPTKDRVVDSGPGVVTTSLKVGKSTMSWTNNGATKTAPF